MKLKRLDLKASSNAQLGVLVEVAPLLPAYNVLFAVKELDSPVVGKKIPPSKTTFLKLTSELSALEREYLYFRIKFRMLAMREILYFCLQILTQIEKC